MKRKPKKTRAARGEGPSKGFIHGEDGIVWVDIPPGTFKEHKPEKPDVSMSSLSMGCSVPAPPPCPLCMPGKCTHR